MEVEYTPTLQTASKAVHLLERGTLRDSVQVSEHSCRHILTKFG